MFIDADALDRFYDAVVAPTFREETEKTITVTKEQKDQLEASLKSELKFGLPSLISSLFSVSAAASAKGETASSDQESDIYTVRFRSIETPQRRLLQLAVFYFLEQPHRVFSFSLKDSQDYLNPEVIQDVPRALAFIEIPAGEKVFPTAAEFRDEQVEPLYDKLHADNGAQPPKYPTEEGREYFKWFRDHVTTMVSLKMIEQAAKVHGRIEWINLRIPYTDEGENITSTLGTGSQIPDRRVCLSLDKTG
jgi:hypothetical protein